MGEGDAERVLEGTTRKVFRFVYRQRSIVGIHDIQRGVGLSSPSVAHYHVSKLLKLGLLREDGGGYLVNKVAFENMLRVRRTAIPTQLAYAAFFSTSLIIMILFTRSTGLSSGYLFAITVMLVASSTSFLEVYRTYRVTP